ncbi:organic cation transporter protein-like isoform X2 [Oratosquilla oratoria]
MEQFNSSAFNNACFMSTDLFPDELNDTSRYAGRNKRQLIPQDGKNHAEKRESLSHSRSRRFAAQETSQERKDVEVSEGVPCVAWEYDNSTFTSTFTTEFDLVCDRAHLRPLYQMVFSVGYAIGDLLGGVLTDRIGRRSTFCLGGVVSLLCNFLLYLVPDHLVNLILRFVIALSTTVLISPLIAATSENSPGRYRSLMVIVSLGLPYSVSILFLSTLAYFVRDWRALQLAFSLPGLLLIPLFYFLDESPRWLAMQNRHDDALEILENAARLNKADLPSRDILMSVLISMHEKQKIKTEGDLESSSTPKTSGADAARGAMNKSFLETLRTFLGTPTMRRITLLTPLIWFMQGLVYLGIPLNVHNFSGSPFVYVALTATAELPPCLFGSPLTTRFGRIKVLVTLFVLSGSCSLLGLLVPEDMNWLRWVLMMLGMTCIGTTFLVSYIHVPEMFPTCVRGQGTALCAFIGHIGYVVAPFVTDVLSEINPIVPSVVFGSGGIVAGVLMPLLPETNHLPLCETAEDVEIRAKKAKATVASASSKRERTLSQVISDAQISASIPQNIGVKSNDYACCVIEEIPSEEAEAVENDACEEVSWSSEGNTSNL